MSLLPEYIRYRSPWAGGILLLVGLALVFAAAWREHIVFAQCEWRDLLIAIEADSVPDGAFPLHVRPLPESNLPPETRAFIEDLQMRPGTAEMVNLLGITHMERLIMVATDPAGLAPILTEGRLPQAGQPEVLAGALTRFDTFTVDTTTFEVVGRIEAAAPGLLTTYLLPEHADFNVLFTDPETATTGWLAPNGVEHLDLFRQDAASSERGARFLAPMGQLPRTVAGTTLAGMLLVAMGGAMVQLELLRRYARRAGFLLAPFLGELAQRPRLLLFMHLLLYGALFASMLGAFLEPRFTWNAVRFVRTVFSEGELEHIGRAYQSGNILRATIATFHQNYVVATCTYTLVPSFVLPFAGVIKNLMSFTFVGLVMSPLWTGAAAQNTYHSITMTLELEAYVLTAFAVSVLPLRVFQGIRRGDWAAEYLAGARVIASVAVLAALMLTVAAVYEATTLILLN